jgi:hypothetical protein
MSLRTRIALTFLLLLAAVLAAALGAVSAANNKDAADEAARQLDVGASVFSNFLKNNDRLLTQAATAVAADYGFRDAVAPRPATYFRSHRCSARMRSRTGRPGSSSRATTSISW